VDDDDAKSDITSSSSSIDLSSLGVGLAVVARYVRNMKGQIRVQSELGKGTIFGIELPFEHANPSPIAQLLPLPTDNTPPPSSSPNATLSLTAL